MGIGKARADELVARPRFALTALLVNLNGLKHDLIP